MGTHTRRGWGTGKSAPVVQSLSSTLSWSGLQRKQKATCQTVWHFLGPRRQPSYSQTLPSFLLLLGTACGQNITLNDYHNTSSSAATARHQLRPRPPEQMERGPLWGLRSQAESHTQGLLSPGSAACWPSNLGTFPYHSQCLHTLCNQG